MSDNQDKVACQDIIEAILALMDILDHWEMYTSNTQVLTFCKRNLRIILEDPKAWKKVSIKPGYNLDAITNDTIIAVLRTLQCARNVNNYRSAIGFRRIDWVQRAMEKEKEENETHTET
jgi:hypothetical protein